MPREPSDLQERPAVPGATRTPRTRGAMESADAVPAAARVPQGPGARCPPPHGEGRTRYVFLKQLEGSRVLLSIGDKNPNSRCQMPGPQCRVLPVRCLW